MRDKVLEFYKKYQPEKINVVDIVIEQWNGSGKDLLNILHQRYCNDEYIEEYQEEIIETTNNNNINNKDNSINENNTTIGESTTLDRISISPIKLFVTEPNNINQLDQQNDVNLRKSTVPDNTIESNTTIMLNTQTEETPVKINENNNKTIEDTPFICKNAFSNHIIDNYLKKEDKLSPSSPCLPNTENSGIISLEKQNSSENKISDEKNINSSGFSDESTIILPITEKTKENNNNLLDLVKIELFPVKEESINTSLNESNQNTTKDDNSSDKNDNLNQSTFLTDIVEDVSTSKNKKSKSPSKNKKSKNKSKKRNNNKEEKDDDDNKNPTIINNEDNLNEKKDDDEEKNIIEKESVSESIKSTIGKKNMLKKLDDCVSEEYINIRNEQSDDGNIIKLSTDNKRKRINKNSPRKKGKNNVNSDDYHVLFFYIDCFYWYI